MVYLSNPHICIHHTDFCTSMTCRKRRARLSKRPLLCYTVTHKVIFKLSIAMIFGCHLETCLTIYQMFLKNLTGNQKYIKTFLFSFRSPSSSSRVSSSSWRMNCQMGNSWRNEEQDLDWRPEAAPGFAQARRGKNRHCLRIYRCSGIKQVWVLYFPWFLGFYVSTCVHKR